jgi:hypothetical protein
MAGLGTILPKAARGVAAGRQGKKRYSAARLIRRAKVAVAL